MRLVSIAQDHKRAYDDDKAQHGGIEAISCPLMTETLRQQIMEEVIQPVAQAMADAGTPYRGVRMQFDVDS